MFHAGDLNNWHWMDESPEAEWKHDEAFFLRELEDIAIYTDRMDVVLFPVDPGWDGNTCGALCSL